MIDVTGRLQIKNKIYQYAHLDTSSVNDVGKVITNVFSTKKEVATA